MHLNAQQFVNEPTNMATWGPTSLKRTMQDFYLAMIPENEMIEYFDKFQPIPSDRKYGPQHTFSSSAIDSKIIFHNLLFALPDVLMRSIPKDA